MKNLRILWFGQTCELCSEASSEPLCDSCTTLLDAHAQTFTRDQTPIGFAIFDYTNQVAELIHHFKLNGSKALAKTLARLWVGQWAAEFAQLQHVHLPLMLVPAPSRAKATRQRGFVPAELLARALAKDLRARGWQASAEPLVWLKHQVRDQSLLNVDERRTNLRGSMAARSAGLTQVTIAIVDDVVTTGATAAEMTRALAESGNSPRFLFAIAETKQKFARQN